MKHKTIISALALILAATTLSACTASAGRTTLKSYWFYDEGVQKPAATETLVYDISFDKGSGLDSAAYELDYTNGKYETKLSLNYRENADETYYIYETSLSVDVVFTYKGETKSFTDTVKTKTELKNNSTLTPISSTKTFVSHSPSNTTPSSIDGCFVLYDYSVETNYTGTASGKSVVKGTVTHAGESPKSVEKTPKFTAESKLTYIDNEALLLALRGITQKASTSHSFYSFDYGTSSVQTVQASFGGKKTGVQRSFTLNGEAYKGAIDYYEVDLVLQKKNAGATQKLHIAKAESSTANTYRNVILEMNVPLSYSYGTLIYKLSNANFFAI